MEKESSTYWTEGLNRKRRTESKMIMLNEQEAMVHRMD